jgi:hypothetical protein
MSDLPVLQGSGAGREVAVASLRSCSSNGSDSLVAAGSCSLSSLTTTRAGNATVEVARRQRDGSWLWMIDQPNVLG